MKTKCARGHRSQVTQGRRNEPTIARTRGFEAQRGRITDEAQRADERGAGTCAFPDGASFAAGLLLALALALGTPGAAASRRFSDSAASNGSSKTISSDGLFAWTVIVRSAAAPV